MNDLTHAAVYLRLLLFPATALALYLLATGGPGGRGRFPADRCAMIAWLLVLWLASMVRTVYGPAVSVVVNDYLGVPLLTVVCLLSWRAVWQARR